MHMVDNGFGPLVDGFPYLGWSGKYWKECRANTFYDSGGELLDTHDDLVILSEFKPKKRTVSSAKTGEETEELVLSEDGHQEIDVLTLPNWLVDRDAVRHKLKTDNGDMITDADIDEWIEDYEEAGWLVGRNVSRFNDLTNGAVRQLDTEMISMFELLSSRITALEQQLAVKDSKQ